MNKYVIILIVLIALVGGGIVYSTFFAEKSTVEWSGTVREYTIIAKKDMWTFDPDFIEVEQGDKVILTIVNEDNYDHGIALDFYGISQRIPALETIKIEFTANKAGDFPYYCSVSCGEGTVNGVKRGHFDQIGKLRVTSSLNEAPR